MSIKSLVIAATVAAGMLCTADQADAQWRRGRATYNYGYTTPSYSYSPGVVYSSGYSPGVVYSSSYSSPTYYTTSDGVVVASYSTPYSSSSYYANPSSGSYYNNGYYNSPYNSGYYNTGWGMNNVYGNGLYGVGTRGAYFGGRRVRW